ncbi:uncharacterized protein RJT20DRAFT_46567 [Scheffersomyces xylosifermentans]|uniref:uncharacterized protein n=1 Tax=Scheffersomyces xylosifermentans TaxID=1304137 RepID=UPI00315CA9B5
MSLFRTLQHSPATLTIFHDATIPLSAKLFHVIEKAYHKLDGKKANEFQIDLMANRMPTFDQYQSLVANCLHDSKSKSILHNCYPFLTDRKTASTTSTEVITIKGHGNHFNNKIFNEGEYNLIYETFNKLKELPEAGLDINPSDIFRAPLVVDWDQNLIAGDESSLADILKKYQT